MLMTDNEIAEARRLVKYGIEQGWISKPVGPTSVWDRPEPGLEGQTLKDASSATQGSEQAGERME
jgi:hypothetical protein